MTFFLSKRDEKKEKLVKMLFFSKPNEHLFCLTLPCSTYNRKS